MVVLCVFFIVLSTTVFAAGVECEDCHGTNLSLLSDSFVSTESNSTGHWREAHNHYKCNNTACGKTFWDIHIVAGSWGSHSFGSYYVVSAYHSGGYDHYTLRRNCSGCSHYEEKNSTVSCNGGSGCCSITPLSFDNVFPE